MQEFALQDSLIMDFEFEIAREEKAHSHQNIELLYVLDGQVKLAVGDEEYNMKPDELIIINTNKMHSYKSEGEALIGCIHINSHRLSSILNTTQILFWCNSAIDKNEAYDELRALVKQIFNQYTHKKEQGRIYLTSLYYQLLHILVSNFLVKSANKALLQEKDADVVRVSEIVNYINVNYSESISLNELAEKLFLSVSYLSKYIKKKLGQSFIDYVNNIRLYHAMDDLLYTDESIIHISLNNGFANTAAFNEVFRKAYQMTPTEYRIKMRKRDTVAIKVENQQRNEKIMQKVSEYMENSSILMPADNSKLEKYITVDTLKRTKYERHWNKMINAGPAGDLLRSDMQEHILLLKKELNFQYVRFWDIYSDELYIDEDNQQGKYNFDKLDKILDFLVENGLRPYIELGHKPQRLYRTLNKPMILKEREARFHNFQDLQKFMNAFASHLSNRYGVDEIENWYFERWVDERYDIEAIGNYYFEVFEYTYKTMKRISPQIKVGGAGIGIQFGRGNLLKLIQAWEKRSCYPDFLSLYCYPYIKGEENGIPYAKVSTDRDFLKNQLSMAKELITESKLKDVEIHVSEWNSTVSNRNSLNDSCFKGAYIMKSIIDSIGEVNVLGYWLGSDIFAEFYDSQILLNGGCGLISKDGIKKPAFYAFDLLNNLGKYLLGKNSNSILTAGGYNDYFIACHNYRHLNYKYYLKQEDDISLQKQYQMFEDNEELKIGCQIENIQNGTYQVKIYSVNSRNGSVQDEWKNMNIDTHLSKREVDYLKRICTPRIFIKTCTVNDGVLKLETSLLPQEIQYIHIQYLYD